MFVEAFPKLEHSKFIRVLRAYFGSPWNAIVVALLMTVSALFGWEIPVAYCYLVIVFLVCFFCEDTLGLVPVVCFTPLALSVRNNPTKFSETIFSTPSSLLQIGFCAALLAVLMIARLISLLIQNPRRGFPKLTAGFAALIVAYMIGGVGSSFYSAQSALFGLMEGAAICTFYFYFYFTVNWKNVRIGFLPFVFAVLGFALVVQTLNMYFQEGVMVDGVIDRSKLFPGWGTYNNIGCITAMCVPAVFYCAATQKQGWIFTLLATVVMLGVVLTQSRGAILFGAIVYLAGAVTVLVKTKKLERYFHIAVFAAALITVTVCVAVFREKLKNIFDALLDIGLDDDGRKPLFEKAWEYFLSYPVFGVGWGGERWVENGGSFINYFMAHNTYLQILGCLGTFGMIAYAFHRAQTLLLFLRRITIEKFFIALIVAALLMTCWIDCHIFSVYPAIYYSICLVFLEGIDKREKENGKMLPKRKRRKKERDEVVLQDPLSKV